jgi:hypothetical protein
MLRGEGGFSTLVIVLVILALGAIIITPLLAFVITGQRAGRTHNEVTDRLYAADTGIQDGMWRVLNDQLPPDWLGTWDDPALYDENYTYMLPQQINGCDVTVTLRAVWLLAGLEEPGNSNENAMPHQELVTVSNVMGSGEYKIVIIDNGIDGTYWLERIGVWLPAGFTYTVGSSNLEQLPEGDDAHLHPRIEPWKNGHTVIWDYALDAPTHKVDYADLPSESATRRVITFNYTPEGPMANAFSWCRTNRNDIYLSWSGDVKQFQLEATATDSDTGRSTTVIAANMKNVGVSYGQAVNGDYVATGNALVRDTDEVDDYYRDRLYKESPAELTGVPDSGTPRKIMLYWSGWKSYPMDVWYHESEDLDDWSDDELAQLRNLVPNYRLDHVSLKVEVAGYGEFVIAESLPADSWQVVPNADHNPSAGELAWDHPNGWSYSCCVDVTTLVNDYFYTYMETHPGFEWNGNATYKVGHAEIGTAPAIDDTLQGIWGSSADDIYVVGDSGTIVHYDGASWSTVATGTTEQNLKAVWGSSGNDVWTVGDRRNVGGGNYRFTIVHGTDNGSTWTDLAVTSGQNLKSIWGSSATDIWAVGDAWRSGSSDRYTILHTTNGGTSWTNTNTVGTSTPQTLYGVWGPNADYVYAVGAGGRIICYTSATSAWASMTSGTTSTLRGVWGSAWNDVYAVGNGGIILHYGGTSWSAVTSSHKPLGFSADLYGVWGTGGTVYAVGEGGAVLECSDGVNWTAMDSNSTQHLYGAWGSSTADVYAVGVATKTAGTLLHYDGNAAKDWTSVTGGYAMYGWVDGHSGETKVSTTDYRLGDNSPVPAPARHSGSSHINANYQGAYAAWSVIVIYTSPETAGHQIYMYDTLTCWLHEAEKDFPIEGFLAPSSVATDPAAARVTCFIGEGDSWDNPFNHPENIWLNGVQLNNQGTNQPLESGNVWNSVSNAMTPSLDGLDLDTFLVAGDDGAIEPGDTEATLTMNTWQDVWQLAYIILSFRSDLSGTGLLSYIVE